MKTKGFFLFLILVISIIFFGCSKNNPTGPANSGGSDNIVQQVHYAGKLQDDNDSLLSALLQKGDKTKALDSIVSIISKDTSVSFCNENSQGIIIQYKNGIRGGIFLDPEDSSGTLFKNNMREKSNYFPFIPKPKIIPGSKKTIFINPHYSDRIPFANSIMNLENIIFPRVGFNAPVTFLDTTATIDVFSNLAGYGIIHIYSHGWAWPNKHNITDIYLMTGENVNDGTTKKYFNEISQGNIPLVKIHNGAKKYFISADFFASKNNFEKDSSIVYGGFCFGFLGSWPDRMINVSKASAYTGFTWAVRTNWNAGWAKSLFDSLSNKTYKTAMSLDDWFTNTPAIPKQYYDDVDNVTVRIEYAGRSNLTLWGQVQIDSISPNHGKINDIVAIYGKGFGNTQSGSSVSFNGVSASPASWTDTRITTPVPDGTTSGYVIVKKGNDESNKVNFTVDSGLLEILHTMNRIDVECSFDYYTIDSSRVTGSMGVSAGSLGKEDTVIWSGNNFLYAHTDTGSFDNIGSKDNDYKTITGTVSNDAKTVTQLVYEHKSEYYDYYVLREVDTEKMTMIDVPVVHYPGYEDFSSSNYTDFLYQVENSDCLQHVSSMEWRWIDYSSNTDTIIGKDKIKDFWSPIKITFSR